MKNTRGERILSTVSVTTNRNIHVTLEGTMGIAYLLAHKKILKYQHHIKRYARTRELL